MTDCLKCNFPRDEPKGERVCKKCGRLESRPKGSVHRTIVADNRTPECFVPDPLAAFLPDSQEMGTIENNCGIVTQGQQQGDNEIKVLMTAGALAEYPLGRADPPTEPVDDIPQTASVGADTSNAVDGSPSPAHSPLGGSGAKRWMNCTGSTALIQQLDLVEDDNEYSREGTAAHELLAFCLEHEVNAVEFVDLHPLVDPGDAPYVQAAIDYVRSRPGRKRYEVPFHRPELHELMRGVVDVEMVPVMGDIVLEVADYKHGAGVYVPVVKCEQLMYYAAATIMEDETFYPDDGIVRLTIMQPRIVWADEPIRSWDTTVGEIKRWLREECLPAMNVRTQDMVLSLGEWCQFCPAKLVCRAMTEVYKQFSGGVGPLGMSDEQLGTEYSWVQFVKMRVKAIEQEVLRRLMEGKTVPLAQLERGRTERVWKDVAEQQARAAFGDEAVYATKFMSPAQIEKLPGGKEFVAEWAYQPEGALKAAPAGTGKAVQLPSPEERYAGAAEALFANKTA